MMLTSDLTFLRPELSEVLEILSSQATAMRPTHTSVDEDGRRAPILASTELERMLDCAGGHLWAPECSYSFRISNTLPCGLFVLTENAEALRDLVTRLSDVNLEFGYACALEEREHRNRIVKKMNYGLDHTWVGRDHTRYLSGLYWHTIIPARLQKKLGVPLEALKTIAKGLTFRADRNWLIRLYESPIEWRVEAPRIDNWCAQTTGCFSKTEVELALTGNETFMEASTVMRQWK